jgi:ATP-dependent DNA helicase RecG
MRLMSRRRLLLYAPPEDQIPVRYVKGVGRKGADILEASRFAIRSVQQLLQHYPRRHLDFSETKDIYRIRVGDEVTVIGEVRKVKAPPRNRPRLPLNVTIYDGTSTLTLVFFNQPWRANQLKVGTTVAAKGKVSEFRGRPQMNSPLVDVIKNPEEVVRIVPLYPATGDIHTAWLRRIIKAALEDFSPLEDPLPVRIRERYRLTDRTSALSLYHFPNEMSEVFEARRRLVFDELFTLQTGLAYRKRRIAQETVGIAHKPDGALARDFVRRLPFQLTRAQRQTIEEIERDMARPVPMQRLLHGEVGSGKTAVALYAALLAAEGGYQAAIMAPTEVLAGQHFLTIKGLLQPTAKAGTAVPGQGSLFGGPEIVLLTGGVTGAARKAALSKISMGSAAIVVGTHALIQEGVAFANLGLAVVDEQHRFGVHQRLALKEKVNGGAAPDVLIMTATPIPRTLALTLYGDLDVSVLDELPAGRKPVMTEVVEQADRKRAYDLVRQEVGAGRQAYVICPLVEESDKLEVAAAEAEAARLATEVFPDLRVGKIHGRMGPAEKQTVMGRFRAGEINVLISTTVIEVGVDVPNATIMLIEDADRFGLSQLHQLRGRIGRGEHPSICLLLTSVMELPEEERVQAKERLEAVAATRNGFELAEKDLEIRGAGTIMGTRQAGWSDLRLTNLVRDIDILRSAREEAFSLVESDPELAANPVIRKEMEGRFSDRLDWLFRS